MDPASIMKTMAAYRIGSTESKNESESKVRADIEHVPPILIPPIEIPPWIQLTGALTKYIAVRLGPLAANEKARFDAVTKSRNVYFKGKSADDSLATFDTYTAARQQFDATERSINEGYFKRGIMQVRMAMTQLTKTLNIFDEIARTATDHGNTIRKLDLVIHKEKPHIGDKLRLFLNGDGALARARTKRRMTGGDFAW